MKTTPDGLAPLIKSQHVGIASEKSAALSPAQQAFNKLIAQIETQREKLSAWDSAHRDFQQKYQLEFMPLINQHQDIKIQIIYRLDEAFDKKGLSKAERSQLVDLIIYLAEPILAERMDEPLADLVDKYQAEIKQTYADQTYADQNQMKLDSDDTEQWYLKTLLAEMTGTDLADYEDNHSPEELMRLIQEHLAASDAAVEAQIEARRAAQAARQSKRKKTAKQMEKEARLQAEAQAVKQSIREVYRKLASALHPDREPDPIERARKNDLMQRANQAYEHNNLYQLLEMQIELARVDQSALGQLSDERLQRFIITLKAELKSLTSEVQQAAFNFHHTYSIDPAERLTPTTALRFLAREVLVAKRQALSLEQDLAGLRDVKAVKSWLRAMQGLSNPW
ncbi:MAG: J domain-containing protein [Halothiobacillaceae bacterium]|nr:J domain-containing protein [Halothiobacillaceae bacterium]